MKGQFQFNDAKKHRSQEQTVYLTSAPTKLSEKKSSGTYLEFVDHFGKKYVIHCRTRKQLAEGMKYLAMFKREKWLVDTICAQYNVKLGKFQNAPALRKDLAGLVGKHGVKKLVAMK